MAMLFKGKRWLSVAYKKRLPAILSDIDGVVYRGGHEIGNSNKVIQAILNHKIDDKYRLPFALLTNGGGIPEQERADYVNHVIGLDHESCKHKLKGEDMIICHSPFRAKELVEEYKDKYVLVSGVGKMIELAKLYGYKKAIEIEELFALYPSISPVSETHYPKGDREKKKREVLERLNTTEDQLKKDMQFHAIFLWSDAVNLDLNLQVFSDLLITKDGRLGKSKREQNDPQFVKLFMTNPDLIYAEKFPIPRHGQGILIHCLKEIFQGLYNLDVEFIQYGKPERLTFDYAESLFLEKAHNQGFEVSNYYMIGDNPEGDIEGANRKGWNSILVRTGLFSGEGNHSEHPAKYVVQDMEEAVKLISELEKIDLSL